MGADIIVMSTKSELDNKAFLFSGEFTDRYFPLEDVNFLKDYDEIDKITEEFFTHTLSAGCCTVGEKLRIVGINQDTDFLIRPWLEENDIKRLKDNEVLIGSDVALPLGSKLGLLGQPFILVGSMHRTGTSMDRTIYMNIDVSRKLAENKMQKSLFLGRSTDELVTSLFIKLKPNSDIDAIRDRINEEGTGVVAYSKAETISKLEDSIRGWNIVLISIIVVVLLNSILSLYGRFNYMMKERKKEIGYLRSLGMSKKKVLFSLLYEVLVIALIGGLFGSLIVLIVSNPVLDLISKQFMTPKTTINIYNILKIIVFGPVLAFIIGLCSSFTPIYNSSKMEPREAMAKGGK